jgi:5-methylcytosine-specific restriction endonuclease McrA
VVRRFFDERCCYCDVPFDTAHRLSRNHLIPINTPELGLHSWGNVVASCRECNGKKQGSDWREFIIDRATRTAVRSFIPTPEGRR